MEIAYDRLKNIASEVRAELALKGTIDVSGGKIRKKPRSKEKTELLYTIAMKRMAKYRPRKEDGKIILPYFLTIKEEMPT